ncbi:MAG: hypothetical protein HY315_00775 [Acidobacteria bacterium]|nr:hypothetical protein [Acidobacteriota bacterium]
MGTLSNDMTRLCGEIGAMRQVRGALRKYLTLEAISRRTAVSALRAAFRRAHVEMASRSRDNRQTFLFSLKRMVTGKRREHRADLMGARQAWFGKGARGLNR